MEKSILVIKASCIIQIFNALMDYLVFMLLDYYVPSWSLATVMLFNAVVIWCIIRDKEKRT